MARRRPANRAGRRITAALFRDRREQAAGRAHQSVSSAGGGSALRNSRRPWADAGISGDCQSRENRRLGRGLSDRNGEDTPEGRSLLEATAWYAESIYQPRDRPATV